MSEALLRDYLKGVEKYHKAGIATEHTYRPALQHLLESSVQGITATNEPKRVKCGAPDYVISRDTGSGSFTVGYVEAKDIVGISLDKVESGEQMGRYKRALDNLILTDYLEFRWYVKGEKQMSARLATAPPNKPLGIDKEQLSRVDQLLHSFLEHSAEPIRRPEELARRMARLTHIIRDTTIDAFEKREASETLSGLYEAFKSVLLPDLPVPQFADMFAQTLAYGLFAARYNHKGREPFNRRDAAKEIPKTNPFLRKLFNTIAGADFDEEPFIGFVNELTQVLGVTDMDAVLADFGKRTRQEDPIVHFYETFLAQYDPKLRELRGVYYTPEPVVSYIVRSVDALLQEQFDCPEGLADTSTVLRTYTDQDGKEQTERIPRVLLLDPACGTGTFSYNIIDHIRSTYRKTNNAGMWSGYVRDSLLPRLFGFELLMAPYAVAHLKLGMQLAALDLPPEERENWAYDFKSDERLGVYLTNTLEQALGRSKILLGSFISDEANDAAKVKQDYPVMVIVGNPPYSYQSANTGKWISNLIRDYYQVDGKPLGERNPKGLQDDYVKFIRFAQWRIEQTGYGILGFVCNHGYLDNSTFRGMRRSLMKSFDEIYVLDLHGSSKKKQLSPDGSKDENVFDIQQGVAIGIFVKHQRKDSIHNTATVHHAHLWGVREGHDKTAHGNILSSGKYHWLAQNDIASTEWTRLEPSNPSYLFIPQNTDLLTEYNQGYKVIEIFAVNSVGMFTARDSLTIHMDEPSIWNTIVNFTKMSSEDIRIRYNLNIDSSDWKVELAQKDIKASGPSKTLIVPTLYRPFDVRYTYYTGNSNGFHSRPRSEVMHHMFAGKNVGLGTTRSVEIGRGWEHVFCASHIIQNHTVSLKEANYLFPLYLYPDPNKASSLFDFDKPSTVPGGRRPNLSPAFITVMEDKLNMRFVPDGKGNLQEEFGPEDVFHYMYAVFHAPTYRTRYAEFLKIDFPRLPLTSDADLFRSLCGLGERLVGLHLMEQFSKTVVPSFPARGSDMVEKVEYLEPKDEPQQGRVYINKTQYFAGVPPEVWNFHVGGYQVCHKWLKDRKGRVFSFEDIKHYQRIVAALAETITLMERIDEVIEEHGGWPLE